MKSIGHSLYEDMKLDKNGKCINANLTDYGAPMIDEDVYKRQGINSVGGPMFPEKGSNVMCELFCEKGRPMEEVFAEADEIFEETLNILSISDSFMLSVKF